MRDLSRGVGTSHRGSGPLTYHVDSLDKGSLTDIASVVIQFQEMRDHVIPAQDSWAGLMTTCFALCSDLCLMTDPPHKSCMTWFIASLLSLLPCGRGTEDCLLFIQTELSRDFSTPLLLRKPKGV